MKLKFTLSIMLLALLTACKKTTNVDVMLSTSGKLTYRLLDDSGKGMANIGISLFDNVENNQSTKVLLDTKTTNQDGQVDFGDLNPSNYLVVPDSPLVNNVRYNVQDYVQVITGTTKNREAKVSDFSGTYNFRIFNYTKNQVQPNVGILMIPSQRYLYFGTTQYYAALADYKGVTDARGQLSLKVPSDKAYTIYVYNTATGIPYSAGSMYALAKNQTSNLTFNIYEN
jgi:5-hydroxyisourate hydrolase-like protein (transthyretin family)